MLIFPAWVVKCILQQDLFYTLDNHSGEVGEKWTGFRWGKVDLKCSVRKLSAPILSKGSFTWWPFFIYIVLELKASSWFHTSLVNVLVCINAPFDNVTFAASRHLRTTMFLLYYSTYNHFHSPSSVWWEQTDTVTSYTNALSKWEF